METFEFPYPLTPPYVASTGLRYLNEPFPVLLENDDLDPHLAPASPSPDLDAFLHQRSPADPEESSSSDDPDVLMADFYLDYFNEILMSEEDDASPPLHHTHASYDSIVRSLYDVIGEPLPFDSTFLEDDTPSFESSDFSMSPRIDANHSAKSNDDLFLHKSLGTPSSFGECGEPTEEELCSATREAQERPDVTTISNSLHMSFEELKLEDDYASLYVGALSLSNGSSNDCKGNSKKGVKKKSSRAPRQTIQSIQKDGPAAVDLVDLRELLVNSAQAVAVGNVRRANEIFLELYGVHGVSPQGNTLQRLAHYFCDALNTRVLGIGGQQYRINHENAPAVAALVNSLRVFYQSIPFLKVVHYFANQKILKAAERSTRLHILDFGIMHGMQWPCLIKALADRDGGPPFLVITGIEKPKPGKDALDRLKETGNRLTAYASKWNVPFQFETFVSEKWENIDSGCFQLRKDEVLVINAIKCLSQVSDESIDLSSSAISPREKLLLNLRSLNPHLLLMSDLNLAGSSPYFASRFRETVYFFHSLVDMLDTICCDESDKVLLQRNHQGLIQNIVACEGAERVKRPDTFKQWDSRFKRAGFELLPIPSAVMSRAVLYVKQHYHKDFMVLEDANGWMLLGWKGRTFQHMSAWKPNCAVV